LLIIAVGAVTMAASTRIRGWTLLDPTHLSTSFGPIGNALTAASVRWDALHYLSVAAYGYKPAGDTQFFPLYPLLIRALGWVVRSDVIAGLLISLTAFVVALVLLHRLTREELGERAATATVLLLAFAPLSFFFTAIYTESLLLALSVGSFYLARHGRFVPACVVGAFAALTHGEGFLIAAPLAYMYWERRGRPRHLRGLASWEAPALLLPICAFAAVFVYEHALGFGWLAPITSSHSIGHGHMMVINSNRTSYYGGAIEGPLVTIWRALIAGGSGFWHLLHGATPISPTMQGPFTVGFENLVLLVVLLISLFSLAVSWKRLPAAYSIYATLVVVLFTSRVTDTVPLVSFDRYMLPAFPLWMSAGAWFEEHRLTRHVLELSTLFLVFYTIEFSRWILVA
jgi:hypothetical protein